VLSHSSFHERSLRCGWKALEKRAFVRWLLPAGAVLVGVFRMRFARSCDSSPVESPPAIVVRAISWSSVTLARECLRARPSCSWLSFEACCEACS
jgi:hypothetical protein